MLFSKEVINPVLVRYFKEIKLNDPVTGTPSEPEHVTINQEKDIYLASLSNRTISSDHEMPRYFALFVKEQLVFFYVINMTDFVQDVPQSLYVKGIKIPRNLAREVSEIYTYIIEALKAYYADYLIGEIEIEAASHLKYYEEFLDGKIIPI